MGIDGRERRRNPRLEVNGGVQVVSVSREVAVSVLNASRDGLLIQSSVPYSAGQTDSFRFITREGDPIALHARVVHTMTIAGGAHLIGLEFLNRGTHTVDDAIEQILSAYTATLDRGR